MKIEMMLPSLPAAGMEVMVARMARKLVGRGHQIGVTCIVARGPLADELEAAGVRVDLPGAQGFVNPRWLFRLRAHLHAVKPDVLHVHSGAWFKGALAGRTARVPRIVYTAHGFVDDESTVDTVVNRAAVGLTDCVVSVSENLAEVMVRRGLAGRQHCVIANGIDLEMFRPGSGTGEIRRRFGIAPDTMVIGTVARLEPIKNQAMLIEGVARARAEGVDCACVLIGDGRLRTELEAQAARLGIGNRVHFWGLEPRVAKLYPELDIFALTSDAEGTSISLLEAMASGVCPLATDVGGNPAVIGDAGVTVGVRRADELAAAIGRLARAPDQRAAFGAAARARAAALFSDEAMLDAYDKVYRG